MTSTCPSGHESGSDDYCDVCGLPIPAGGGTTTAAPAAPDPAPAAPEPTPAPTTSACPNCQAANPPNALFCEACGYDYTTGSMPRPVTPSVLDLDTPVGTAAADPSADAGDSPAATGPVAPPAESAPSSVAPPLGEAWVAEVWIDPDWYADQESTDPLPSAGVPVVVPLRTTSILVGRTSRSRGIHPDIDLAPTTGSAGGTAS